MERNSTLTEPSPPSEKRKTIRTHVRLFEDQVEEILIFWPRANLSEILRMKLDEILERARELRAKNLAEKTDE